MTTCLECGAPIPVDCSYCSGPCLAAHTEQRMQYACGASFLHTQEGRDVLLGVHLANEHGRLDLPAQWEEA